MTLTATQIADGWKPHDGGECPVDADAQITPMYRGPSDPQKGIRIEWLFLAGRFDWTHDGTDDDIIAYKEQSHAAGE